MCHIVCFVDDDDIPVALLQVLAVFEVLFERVDGDDGAIKVVKRVVVGRYGVADTLQANRVEPGERDGKALPHFALKLRQHRFHREHQNALATVATDQFGDQYAGANGFAQADRIGNQ